ncbi:MAG TPA: hypothetical protein VGK46_02185 [Saprospiraceae bacterium]
MARQKTAEARYRSIEKNFRNPIAGDRDTDVSNEPKRVKAYEAQENLPLDGVFSASMVGLRRLGG